MDDKAGREKYDEDKEENAEFLLLESVFVFIMLDLDFKFEFKVDNEDKSSADEEEVRDRLNPLLVLVISAREGDRDIFINEDDEEEGEENEEVLLLLLLPFIAI